jgi:hypothetical protein
LRRRCLISKRCLSSCRLDGESHIDGEIAPESIILDGPTTYIRESDARWVFARGAEGTRGMFHPSGLLDALVRAQTSAVEVGERSVELGLDQNVLDAAADAGLAPDWQSTAVAQISAQRPDLEHRAHASLRRGPRLSDARRMRDLRARQVGTVDLPPPDTTISLAAKIEQEHDQADT